MSDISATPDATNIRGHLLRNLKIAVFDEATIGLLEAAVNDFFEASGEKTYVEFFWIHDHPDYHAMVVYVEE